MTREEAIRCLSVHSSTNGSGLCTDEQHYKAKQMAIKALEQEPYNFAKWVAREIFDENWEYNKDAFAEIACRKLEKLGIVRAKGDKWELVEQESCDTCEHSDEIDGSNCYECVKGIRNGYNPQPCEDVIDRAEAMTEIMMFAGNVKSDEEDIYIKVSDAVQLLRELPPVNPQYTEYEIQKMQNLEQAEIEKAYELGRAEGQESEGKE